MVKKKRTSNASGTNGNNKPEAKSESAFHMDKLFSSNNLEFVTALLLLAEKLKVDSIELDREGFVAVTLLGQFKKSDKENDRVNHLASFLKQNGDMTMDEIFSVFKKRLSE